MIGLISGALLSGVLVGAAGNVIQLVPEGVRLVVLVVGVAGILVFEFAGRPLRLPQNGRAVPQTIIDGPWAAAPLQFGFEMGTGVRTFMPTALPHALVLMVALAGGLGPGFLAGLGFGVGRSAMPLVRMFSGAPYDWDAQLGRSLRWVGRTTATAFLLAAVVLLVG